MTYTRAEIATALRWNLNARRNLRSHVFVLATEAQCLEEYARALDRWRLRAKQIRRTA